MKMSVFGIGYYLRAGVLPSRISRRAFIRGRGVLTVAFLAVLSAPMFLILGAERFGTATCGEVPAQGCDVHSSVAQALSLGGPALALAIFVIGNALLSVGRAHDLGQELSFCRACLSVVARRDALQRRLAFEDGTAGPNRFGSVLMHTHD